MIRVVLVDDHRMFREGLAFTLSVADDIEVVGEAADGRAALDVATAVRPDVVVLDLAMPVRDGLSVLPELVATGARVLVLTLSEQDATLLAAVTAGASGYLVKGAAAEQVISAVRAVADGHAVFGPGLAQRLVRPDSTANTALSPREREILELVAQGQTNAEIAVALVLSVITVRNHVSNILTKLQVTNRTQAAARARGLV